VKKENWQPRGIAVFGMRQVSTTIEREQFAVISTHNGDYFYKSEPLKIHFAATLCRCNFALKSISIFVLIVMNEKRHPPPGKISLHGNGMGVPSPEDIERRAREIAMIDERNPDEFTDADWTQAREELMGAENHEPPEETPDNAEVTEEWEVVAGSKGHRAPRPGTEDDEETVGEHLVTDGLEEAAHDQMLEARREELEQEGGIT
jgi:hypothetical protein